MRYRIGAFQKLTGLTEGTLRYYEKMKLLRPARHDGNGYRYYDETDLLQLVQIRQFSGFDIPLGHLPREGEDVSCEQMYQQFSAQRNQLEQTIEELHNKLARIKLHEQNFGRIRTELGTVNRSSVGGIYRLFLSDPAVAAHPETAGIVNRWMANMPYTHSTMRIPLRQLRERKEGCYEVDVGIGLLKRYFNELGETFCEPMQYSPANTSVQGIVTAGGLDALDRGTLAPFFRYMSENDLQPIGDLYGWVLYITQEGGAPCYYLSLRVEVA